ncbi:linoleate 13s-lipoxygenase 2-1 chloroplastic [Phtheirospermum japonicum]|uniref:Lipoxygenase n=1 Tax=Phtheirospermum japonicum TaxID=374723 RepID=A0A830C5M2_9LAMI|nr:linoleate 13s-lipoxygenase 2-1 chloroplastic [Phtheirospermum japonicum]
MSSSQKPQSIATHQDPVGVKAVVTVLETVGGVLGQLGLSRRLDGIADLLGRTLRLELVAAELHPVWTRAKPTISSYAHRVGKDGNDIYYETNFDIPYDFGEIGAVIVEHEHRNEMYVKDIAFDGLKGGSINVTCDSWIHTKDDKQVKRVFFSNKVAFCLYSADLLGRTLRLELVAAELHPESGQEQPTISSYAHRVGKDGNDIYYETNFDIPYDFGEIGAVIIEHEHRNEMYVKDIVFDGLKGGSINVTCDSWIHTKDDKQVKRVFFSNKSYLPFQTPSGLTRYRREELITLRGDGQGERKKSDRIYDYDFYNDLGDPDDSDDDLARPVLGGAEHPYPRRCRTGRPRTNKDPLSESRGSNVYVPRDEAFSEIKQATFSAKTLSSVLHALVPTVQTVIEANSLGFPHFTAIDTLFDEGVFLPDIPTTGFLRNAIPRLVRFITNTSNSVLRFETPALIDRDKFAWFMDAEFARQTLAGVNPCCIKLVTEWPLKSNLDPEVYGPAESAITTELVLCEIGGYMSVEEAVKQKKLFILDYHDVFLPYVNKVREITGTTFYGSRTLFFLTPSGTLRPLVIELTRPPGAGKPQWKQVFQPCWDSTGIWLWRLAKAHVLAHDSGYHQLVSHWLRTHCCTEPYIIATHRQLSAMHPIYRLLHPHLRYTMEINALAREALINANGIIETSFSPAKYSMELSSVAYDKLWRFDQEALPADLITSAPHGLKLTIKDYPYATDGLLLWDAIKQWVTDYVTYYYPEAGLVQSDDELEAWWTEIRTVGHADKKDEPWWPELKTPQDLIGILTTIIWVASGHHAAVNFGQFDYAGYFPNRPAIARTIMPTEDPSDEQMKKFLERPEEFLLKCFPSQVQATVVMAIIDVLSNHSPDEEYIGEQIQPFWAEDKVITAAYERFYGRLKEIEGIIDGRNADTNCMNRAGAGVVPYELLKPFSEAGVTGKDLRGLCDPLEFALSARTSNRNITDVGWPIYRRGDELGSPDGNRYSSRVGTQLESGCGG